MKFDLFNLNILNKIIDDFFYEIKQEGIYLNEKKLNLTKIYFHYVVPVLLQRDDFIIDFNKKLIKGCPLKPNFDEMSKELHNKDEYIIKLDKIQIKKLFALFEKYGVYKWNKLEYYERIKGQDCSFRWCDGYHWNLELIFEDKYVLVCGGHCEHPDTYYHFAKEVFDLIGIDLFNCQGEIDDEYTYWGEKHLE